MKSPFQLKHIFLPNGTVVADLTEVGPTIEYLILSSYSSLDKNISDKQILFSQKETNFDSPQKMSEMLIQY